MSTTLITVADARERIARATRPLATATIAVADAYGRVLAADLKAAGDVPPFACSAMDGYAIRAGNAGRTLAVVGESRAGTPTDRMLNDGDAIRISTGAAIPAGADAVIRQEDVSERDGQIETQADTPVGANIREAAEDMLAGTAVLTAGTALGTPELGAAVAAGAGELLVAQRPHATILCTGDELRAPGEPLGPGQIHNSNGVMLAALASRCGAVTGPPERLADDATSTANGLEAALAEAEVVIVSGGVSVGPHDHVKAALARLGVEQQFWGVALQPGKPTWFGTKAEKLVFGLPGNPVSAVVTFTLFVRLGLALLQGERGEHTRTMHAVLGVPVPRNPRREQALRVRLEDDGGRLIALPNGPQGSHIVTSLLGADALALIPPGEGELPAGSLVTLEPLLG